jgi:hypothetical protein
LSRQSTYLLIALARHFHGGFRCFQEGEKLRELRGLRASFSFSGLGGLRSDYYYPPPAMNRYCVWLLALGLLAGCATAPPPPLNVDDPANPSAPEVPARPLRNALGADGLTRKSRQILAQAAKEQQQ